MPSTTSYLLAGAAVLQGVSAQWVNNNAVGEYSACNGDETLCLNSFVWCEEDGSCSFPNKTWPGKYEGEDVNPALLVWDNDYNLTWTSTEDSAVQIRWNIPPADGEDDWATWTTRLDTAENSYTLNFATIAEEFSNDRLSYNDIMAAVADVAGTVEMQYVDNDDSRVTSDQFAILENLVVNYLDVQYDYGYNDGEEDEYETWELGVGIGVGIGVPILMLCSAGLGWIIGKKSGAKQAPQKEVSGSPNGSIQA